MSKVTFEWDEEKDQENLRKHGVRFADAQYAFADPMRVIAHDLSHSQAENRFYLFRKGWRRNHDGPVHVSQRCDPDYRSRILEERKEII